MPLSAPSPRSGTLVLIKPQTTIIVVASFLAILAACKIVTRSLYPESSRSHSGIHRSNAIRRRHRTGTNSTGSDNVVPNLQLDDPNHVEETRFVLVDQNPIDNECTTENSSSHEEYGWSMPQGNERNGQNIVQLLFRVSEDATKRNAYVHRGCACNLCGMVPIRGIRYRCANCADYDLCESCEAQNLHTKTHIFYKIKVPVSGTSSRNMQPVWYTGDPDSVARQLPRETLIKLSRETGFERPELEAQWEQWTFMANTDWREDPHGIHLAMDRKTFEQCLVPTIAYKHASPYLIFDRMFSFYDSNKDGLIGFSEFIHGLAFRKKKDKWKKIFEGYDIDGDGYVDRKDFLRIFRSYYVLYRSLHAEMLDGMVEQQLSGAEAHRLVGSRQPLSSLFGQDGIFPRAPNSRSGEGKLVQANGDLEITDGKGVINESSLDHGNRHDVFKQEYLKKNWTGDTANVRGYWEAILNPPETSEQLRTRLNQIRVIPSLPIDQFRGREPMEPQATEGEILLITQREDDPTHSDSDSDSYDGSWPPTFIQVTDHDAEAVQGPGTRVADVRRSRRQNVISHAYLRNHSDTMFQFLPQSQQNSILQFRTQQDIYKRWQRRHFYTEEEEGESPPTDWKDEYDILVQKGIIGESSKQSRLPLHSRSSSSKVHFAEDTNDYDTRSNPSTSSRSVSERWGGLDIPDAEKDAGKEILYQITQQAFNELLDPLFKDREELAIEAANLKALREKYYHLFTTPDFHKWAVSFVLHDPQKEENNGKLPSRNSNEDMTHQSESKIKNDALSLNFDVESLSSTVIRNQDEKNISQSSFSQSSTLEYVFQSLDYQLLQPSNSPKSDIARDSGEDQRNLQTISPTSIIGDESLSRSIYRDPTMPQFRPNTVLQPSINSHRHISQEDSFCQNEILSDKERNCNKKKKSRHARPANPTPESEEQTKITNNNAEDDHQEQKQEQDNKEEKISDCVLFRLWASNEWVKEAERRGGWGKLNYKEFEIRVKGEMEKDKSKGQYSERNTPRMDYLGSWIEYCIP
ncbi:hypothetical protein EPUL_006692 [Erysiphe pulchra]|uniref:EF-hand n=1 Tax=Erysiphe pulchra TaxID=225359 RepID=A0A2S4PMM5_9PEZI|nr:hypothetical protein EPUL_006692 [Erysiphe pulchra]